MSYPVTPVSYPAILAGQSNGALDPSILVSTPGLAGGPPVRLVPSATAAWRRLVDAAARAGHILKATSRVDSYRPYGIEAAGGGIPGRSNHGWGIAVDVGEERDGNPNTTESIGAAALTWLRANAARFGWSWERQDEPWHLRHFAGDGTNTAVTRGGPTTPPATARPLTGTPTATTAAAAGVDDDGPFPTLGPPWLPWNWPSLAANTAVDAGQQAAGGLLSGARHIAIEAAVSVLGLGLVGLGVYRLTTAGGRAAARRLNPLGGTP